MTFDLPVIEKPRDLALPGRILRSLLACADRINPFAAASQPAELLDASERASQVAGLCASRDAIADQSNADRFHEWAGRYRAHTFDVPLRLPQWHHTFPAADSAMPGASRFYFEFTFPKKAQR